MNDKSVGILENYELTVLRTIKSRGAVLCETDQGLKIVKEYTMPAVRAVMENRILSGLKEAGHLVDAFVRNREGKLLTADRDMKWYAVKDYYEGRECRNQDTEDLCKGMKAMASMHQYMKPESVQVFEESAKDSGKSETGSAKDSEWNENKSAMNYEKSEPESGKGLDSPDLLMEWQPFCLEDDFARHNRELKRVRTFIRKKSRKSEFELYLLKYYDLFLNKALQASEMIAEERFDDFYSTLSAEHRFSHGDFQYHNVMFTRDSIAVVHFEKFQYDSGIRDIALCLRKVSEKNGWDCEAAKRILDSYEQVSPLTGQERKQLFFRLYYPEKFWKIANFYQNSRKAFIPDKNTEKLERLLSQEEAKERFLEALFW